MEVFFKTFSLFPFQAKEDIIKREGDVLIGFLSTWRLENNLFIIVNLFDLIN